MKMKHLAAMALALGLPAVCAVAQNNGGPGGPPPGQGQRRGPRRPPPPIIAALDANHDGIISADEIANAAVALKTLDKDGKGQLTMEDLFRPPPPRGGGPGPDGQGPDGWGPDGQGPGPGGPGGPPPGRRGPGGPGGPPPGAPGGGPDGQGNFHPPTHPVMMVLDTNHDGLLSADEITAAPANLLKLDRDGKGQLTIEQLMGPPPPHGGPGPGGPGPDGPPPGGGQNQ